MKPLQVARIFLAIKWVMAVQLLLLVVALSISSIRVAPNPNARLVDTMPIEWVVVVPLVCGATVFVAMMAWGAQYKVHAHDSDKELFTLSKSTSSVEV